MAVLRYASQEAKNIAKAKATAEQQAKVDAFVQSRKAAASITKTSLGLDNVNNTADPDKPISAATQVALDGKLAWVAVPASAAAAGTAGQIAYASGFLYVCVAANTWQRTALSTW